MKTFGDVIDLWPSAKAMARDIDRSHDAVRKWRMRNSIPATEWHNIVRAAKERGFKLSVTDLADILRASYARTKRKKVQAAA